MKKFKISLLIFIIIGIGLILTQKIWVPKLVNKIIGEKFQQDEKIEPVYIPISIETKEIKEENFSGKTSVILGTSPLAKEMRDYVNKTVSDFRIQANKEVPEMKKSFGDNIYSSAYEIYINSKHTKNSKTESIATSIYVFTGGAHGSTVYKVLTVDVQNGNILKLSDIIKNEKQNDFTDLVKRKLNEWIPEGSESSPVFADIVSDLKFDSFSNWSLDNENLIIYFDQYAIGPSSIGAMEFPISIKDIENFIK